MERKKTLDGGKLMRAKPRKKRWSKDDTELFLLSLPTLLWFLIFSYLPMFGIIIAFKVYKLSPGGHGFIYNLLHSEWAGIGNFKYFFTSNSFSMLLRNTILYNIAFIIISASVAVGGALMLSNMRGSRCLICISRFSQYLQPKITAMWPTFSFICSSASGLRRTKLSRTTKEDKRNVYPPLWFYRRQYAG